MDKKDLKIVFMGTPDFALATLDALVKNNYNVVGVVTIPDKAIGRHHEILTESPVKKYALEKNLTILQPSSLKDENFLTQLSSLKADLQIVVAFRMLPECVWNMPPLGTINLHASLLPQYRGAAPINWAIINGETKTGVTTFYIDHEIDTGKIIEQEEINIDEKDNAGNIHDKLMAVGAQLVIKTVSKILDNSITTICQKTINSNSIHKAPKIFKETCKIDWNLNITSIYNFIRGMSPYPTAWTQIENNGQTYMLKIFNSEIIKMESQHPIGSIINLSKHEMAISLKDGYLKLLDLQLANKKRMLTKDFLSGFKLIDAKVK